MTAEKLPHEWSNESLINKAQRYASILVAQDKTKWQFGFWSALTLEMVSRAALARVSPTLLADGKDWNNTYYALGHAPIEPKFIPRSVDISEVFKRLRAIIPEFTEEVHNFCSRHINLRNTELHSGSLPFESLGTSTWISEFYRASQILLRSQGKDLAFLYGADEATIGADLIKALEDKAAKAVFGTIESHKTAWNLKPSTEKELLSKQAETLASRHIGHRVTCPACLNTGLLQGSPFGAPTQSLEEDVIVERQSMLPSSFECTACSLKVSGYSKLNACGLGDAFIATSHYGAAEYFDLIDPNTLYDDDFNEY